MSMKRYPKMSMKRYPKMSVKQYPRMSMKQYPIRRGVIETTLQGQIQDFKLGGTHLKIAPSGGRREKFWGISCEKSRFYAKKSYFSNFRGGGGRRVRPLDPPLHYVIKFVSDFLRVLRFPPPIKLTATI